MNGSNKKYDSHVVYERIRSLWEKLGCKNKKQFAEYCNEHKAEIDDVTFSPQLIGKWEKGSFPGLDYLTAICNLAGCDFDYLLGAIECTTREATDIYEETGLSEDAVITLNYLKKNNQDLSVMNWFIVNGLAVKLENARYIKELYELKIKQSYSFPPYIDDMARMAFEESKMSSDLTSNVYEDTIENELENKSDEELTRILRDDLNSVIPFREQFLKAMKHDQLLKLITTVFTTKLRKPYELENEYTAERFKLNENLNQLIDQYIKEENALSVKDFIQHYCTNHEKTIIEEIVTNMRKGQNKDIVDLLCKLRPSTAVKAFTFIANNKEYELLSQINSTKESASS